MKKLNNNGFTVIELTLSFAFVFTLAFSMFQLLYNYRVKQNEEATESQLIDYKNQVTMAIQNDITEKSLRFIDYCTNGGKVVDRCLVLHFNDGTSKQLAVETGSKNYNGVDHEINYISYGNLNYEAVDAILLEYQSNYMLYQTYDSDNIENENVKIYRISIPIYHNDLDGNYGIDITAVGYDYKDNTDVDITGQTVQTPPDALQTASGRIYNGYVTSTNKKITSNSNNMTIVARVKFSKLSSFQQFFGNWQLGGGGLSLSSKTNTANNKACFGVQVSTDSAFSSTYKEICSSNNLTLNRFYVIVGTFDRNAKTMKIYVDGLSKGSLTLSSNSKIDSSSLAFAIGGNPGQVKNSNLFYGTISHAIVYNVTLPDQTIKDCLGTSVNTGCVSNKGISAANKIIDEDLIK